MISYRARSLTTRRMPGPAGTRMVHADLVLGGLDVGHASIYADHPDLLANITDAGGHLVDFGYLEMALRGAPPTLGVVSLGWERLCSILLGVGDSSRIQPVGRLSIGAEPTCDPGPR